RPTGRCLAVPLVRWYRLTFETVHGPGSMGDAPLLRRPSNLHFSRTARHMNSIRCSLVRCAGLLIFAALIGCGSDGPQIVPLTGSLTYKGQPVTNAVLWFQPEVGRPSWGQTDEQGQFKLSYDKTRDGAVAGKHKVWIDRRAVTQAERDAQFQGKDL